MRRPLDAAHAAKAELALDHIAADIRAGREMLVDRRDGFAIAGKFVVVTRDRVMRVRRALVVRIPHLWGLYRGQLARTATSAMAEMTTRPMPRNSQRLLPPRRAA